jgi:glycosyltransferase involved in cell wall biosynthesis
MIRISVLVSLYRSQLYLKAFLEHCKQAQGLDQIEFILLHNDPQPEEIAIIEGFLPDFPQLRHINIPEREGLYTTWNRGISLSRGEYITVWNVDDIRYPNSILMQAEALDAHPECGLAYGDIYLSYEYGVQGSKVTNSPLFSEQPDEFYRQYHISCFQMWRKSLHETIGYYDEQFRCCADFDFQVRAALHVPFVKTPSPLGIYLMDSNPNKLSRSGYQDMENNIIYYRYGAYEKLNLLIWKKSLGLYQVDKLKFFGKWQDLKERSPFPQLYKMKGGMVASLKAPWLLAKLTAKKILGSA